MLHGWGFDATLWDAVAALLPEFDCVADDRGYFGEPVSPGGAELVVGHSLGALRALLDPPAGCRAIVAINGFDCFAARPDFPAGVPVRVLDRMVARLRTDADGVVSEFRMRCGTGRALSPARSTALAHDLAALRDADGRGKWAGPLALLSGSDDPILAPAHIAACFADRADAERSVAAGHGHLLPLTAPDLCATAIRTMTGSIA